MRRIVSVTALVLLTAAPAAAEIRVGVAKADVTPPPGVRMYGYGARGENVSTGVHDPLYAKAIVLSDGQRTAAWVTMDLGYADKPLTRDIRAALQRRFPKITLPRKDDICYATQNRQNAVKQLAERAQLVLVVGAPTSSNSQRLVEVAERCGSRAQLVEEASQVDPTWLQGIECVGITAGASAPEALVDGVVEHLKALAEGAELVEFAPVDEGMVFQLPSELR